jgi:predicted nucleotidyltransferase
MVNTTKKDKTILQNKIIRLMYQNAGNTLNAHMIAQHLEVSQPAVSKALPLLEEESIIKIIKDKRSKRLSITLNVENHEVIWKKRADNLEQLYNSNLMQFLYDKLPQTTIVLFGSYANGEDIYSSDIDIAIIGTKEKELDLLKFESELFRKINLNFYDSFEKIHKHLRNSIMNGITLKGAIQL